MSPTRHAPPYFAFCIVHYVINDMNQKLGSTAKAEIRTATQGLVGTALKQEVERLATVHPVSKKYIYGMTKDQRQGNRKPRADKGKRTFELVEGTDVWYAAQLVIHDKLDPDLALLTAKTRGYTKLPTLEYFRQMLAEVGLGKKQRRNPKGAFRSWEAEFPGEIFQIDCTALKIRWQDEKTRRIQKIEGVDKNHPQMDPTKIQVWQILLKDDHSRRVFLRYITARAITSNEMVRFMCEAYNELGVPQKLYTDQGGEFKGRHKQALSILNALPTIKETGGYKHIPHAAGNSKATGKVENGHKWAEKMDRLVGLAITEGQTVTVDTLNLFAERICIFYNNRVHSTTNQSPMVRWHNKRIVVRKLPADIIESALLSDQFECTLDASMTVTFNKIAYKVPGVAPFVDYVGQRVQVVIPPAIDVILLTLPNSGGEYEIEKILATADKAGEFKSVADSTAQELTKRLKTTRKADVKAIRDKSKQTGEIAPVPHLNVEIEQPVTNIHAFPQAERTATREELERIVPLPMVTGHRSQETGSDLSPVTSHSSPAYTGRDMGYWQAVTEYAHLFEGGIVEAKQFLLGIFPETKGTVLSLDIESAIDTRFTQEEPIRLRSVG